MNDFLFDYAIYGLYFICGIIAFIILRGIFKMSILLPHSNWNHLLDGFNFSTKEFYERLKKELHSQGIKKVDSYYVLLKMGGIFSARRLYLRVEWKGFRYDICAAPFGKGFFISWWLLYKNSVMKILIAKIPFVGTWLAKKWFPITYYKIDSASMFMTYCQSSVLKVIEDITKESGTRALTEEQKNPLLNNVFTRK